MPRRSYTLAQTQRGSNAVFDDHEYTETCGIMIRRDVMNMSKRGRTPLDLALLNRSIGFARQWREIDGRGFVGKRRRFRQIGLWGDIRINRPHPDDQEQCRRWPAKRWTQKLERSDEEPQDANGGSTFVKGTET
jgi:hypothetical protein